MNRRKISSATVVLLASLLGGCTNRTEIVLGAATDLKARNQIDEVRLIVSRDGVPLLRPTPWKLTDVPTGPFELPGSFGLYSPDGKEVRLQIQLQGFKDNSQIIERQSILSLISGQTLFTRLTLVSDCNSIDGPSCAAGQGCVEGVCRDQAIDSHTFPRYRKGIETKLECASGFNYVVTSTGVPMPLLDGSAGCPAGELCSEGTCYKQVGGVPDAGALMGLWADAMPPTANLLHAVWQTPDGKDLFAVGDAGIILHLGNGGPTAASAWVMEASPIAANLNAVWGTSVDDVVVAGTYQGQGGIILHRSKGVWTQLANLPAAASLRGLSGTAANDLWIAGVGAPDPTKPTQLAPSLLHWDGATVTRDARFAAAVAAKGAGQSLRAVAAGAGGEVWVAGTGGLVGHFDGAAWTLQQLAGSGPKPPDLNAIAAVAAGEAYVVGQGGFIAHLAGGRATVQTAPTVVDLFGVGARGPDELVAVGDYGKVLRFRGAWLAEESGTAAPLFGVSAAAGSTVEIAVGSRGTVRLFSVAATGPCSGKSGGTCGQNDCAAGFLTTHTCANGVCVAVTPASQCPGVIACADAHNCASKCAADADCDPTSFCNQSGDCAARKDANAQGACNPAADCKDPASCRECKAGLTCVDGFCCTAASCGGICQSCAIAGKEGSCAPAPAGSAAKHGSCPGAGSFCAETCDGTTVDACADSQLNVACGAATCSGSTPVSAPTCGGGACNAGSKTTDCSPYDCSAGACTTSCTIGGPGCASDATCYNLADGGPPRYACLKNAGAQCQSDASCRTGTCALGVCCNARCASYCDYATSTFYSQTTCAGGTCAPVGGGTVCPNNLSCYGDVCATNCSTTWNGSFPMSGWPTGLLYSSCAANTPVCSCIPSTAGSTCSNGTHCCSSWPCRPSP